MYKLLTFTLFLNFFIGNISAQMTTGTVTLYGNEWINYSQEYCKIPISADGVYRLSGEELSKNGVNIASIPSNQYKIYYLGQEIPIYINTTNPLLSTDYIEFYARKNRAEIDAFLYKRPIQEIMNPKYSLFTDTSAYFLTWSANTSSKRYNLINNDIVNPPAKQAYFMHSLDTVFSNFFDKRFNSLVSGDELKSSQYVVAEGFASEYKVESNIQLKPIDLVPSGPVGKIEFYCGWRSLAKKGGTIPPLHKTNYSVNGKFLKRDSTFSGQNFGIKNVNSVLATTEIAPITTVNVKSVGGGNDDHRIAFISLTYPRSFGFGSSKYFYFKSDISSTKQYFVIENIKAGAKPVLYDVTNQIRVEGIVNGTNAEFVLPPSSVVREVIFYLDNSATDATIKKKVKFENYKSNAPDYLIVSNPRLYKDKSGKNWVQEYANYRQSSDGGNYKVAVIDIEQIYDQYAYGIDRHAIALRNFTNYAAKDWSAKFLFLVGRAIEYEEIRNFDAIENESFFIPTYGSPGADNLISASTASNAPILATGRIPATSANDVRIYLEKTKIFEKSRRYASQTIEDRAWMKRVVNLAGGDLKEQQGARTALKNMGQILASNKFGAEVITFEKTSDKPIDQSNSEYLRSLINGGVSILNFFGHSSLGNLDYSIDAPSLMENKEKYFVFFAYGCYSGAAHGVAKNFGTTYILEENKAAIAYIAPGQYGTTDALPGFGAYFNTLLGGTHYEKSIGEIMQSTIKAYDLVATGGMLSLLHHNTLQGDPAIKFHYNSQADYTINPSSAKIKPAIVTVAQDSFNLNFNLANIGANNNDTLRIQIVREVAGKKIATITDSLIRNLTTERNFTYAFPVGGVKAVGVNNFYITLDPKNKIKEGPSSEAETNNELIINGNKGLELTILGSDVIPVYPQNYAIVNKNGITLKASTANPFAKKQKYFIEIDTTANFNSPLKLSTTSEQIGGIISWKPNINLVDSTVYFWRLTPDSTTKIGYIWRTSSFIYLEKGNSGWNQSNYFQFKNDNFNSKTIADVDRRFKYQDTKNSITFQNGVFSDKFQPQADLATDFAPSWLSAYFPGYYLSKSNTGVMVWINDGTTLKSIQNQYPGLYGSDFQNNQWDDFCFPYNTNTPEERTKLINFLEKNVPSKAYVTIMTIQRNDNFNTYFPEKWAADSISTGKNIFQVLEKQGAKKVRNLAKQAVPYIFTYRKDDPTFKSEEVVADSVNQIIKYISKMTTSWKNGDMTSTIIGPANEWSKVYWDVKEIEANDVSYMNIKGIDKNGKDSILYKNINTKETDISSINAKSFPYLKLEWASSDTLNRTAPQLKYWRVTHQGLPDAVLAPNKIFTYKADTLQQGDKLKLRFAAENVSDYNMDSLLISYKIKRANNSEITRYQRVKPLLQQDTIIANFQLDTRGFLGSNELSVRINPRKDQVERDTTNNLGILSFFVKREVKHPTVDVLIDGNHIINGDIVSAKPSILISVKDDNKFLFMDDTSLFKVYLRYPNEKNARLIAFNNPILKFYPASEANGNKASIELNPELNQDGDYQLLVKAKDASGNKSSEYALDDEDVGNPDFYNYKIAFQVITKTAISNVLNYPNPFSTSTQFVYTLTGNEAPAYFKIQILTISGRVVRELTQQELGPLKIGTHKTEYAWDGTDQYGDQLAAGVYLYKVIAKKANGEDFESHESSVDALFKSGIGKMVILR